MTPHLSPLEDSEIIERLAVKVMGWKRVDALDPRDEWCWVFREVNTCRDIFKAYKDWNPLKDWNHWREVEERLMEDGKGLLIKEYLRHFDGKGDYMGSDLRTKCSYLLASLLAIPQSL